MGTLQKMYPKPYAIYLRETINTGTGPSREGVITVVATTAVAG